MNSSIVDLISLIVQYATEYLMPFLVLAFLLAVLVVVDYRRDQSAAALRQGIL